MIFDFAADRIVKGFGYPALAQWAAEPYTPEWRQFGQHWPRTVPVDLHTHCQTHQYPYQLHSVETAPVPSYYSIGISWFDFEIDYIDLLPTLVKQKVLTQELYLLFYYDEGDNPANIKQRMDQLCVKHNLPVTCYRFITANTASKTIPGFAYLCCDEMLYWHRNRKQSALLVHSNPRTKQFTVLNRTHKWWRATVMAHMQQQGILENSYWSYNTNVVIDDCPEHNPIELYTLGLANTVHHFIQQGPYVCDDLTEQQHNDHHLLVEEHFTNAYCHIIIETHFDADGSGGAFLTEKTFKPIKHGQPFVIIGTVGSLEQLRQLGYRVFDHAIDNNYDLEPNNTRRWQMALEAIKKIASQDMHSWFERCRDDVLHNQQLFAQLKTQRLNTLYKALHD